MVLHENVGRNVVVVTVLNGNTGDVPSLTRTLRLTDAAPLADAWTRATRAPSINPSSTAVTVNVAEASPSGMTTLAGTVISVVSLEARLTVSGPAVLPDRATVNRIVEPVPVSLIVTVGEVNASSVTTATVASKSTFTLSLATVTLEDRETGTPLRVNAAVTT